MSSRRSRSNSACCSAMLTRLRLRNFKSWEDTGDLALGPLTVFFGANSSGKTSLLQSILLLKQTTEAKDRRIVFHYSGPGASVDLGDFSTLARRSPRRAAGPLSLDLDWNVEEPVEIRDWSADDGLVVRSTHLGFAVSVVPGGDGQRERVAEFDYRVGEGRFGIRRAGSGYRMSVGGVREFLRQTPGRPPRLEGPVRCYGFPERARLKFRNAGFTALLEDALEHELRRVHYLGPLRDRPARDYRWSGAAPDDMGPAGGNVVPALLSSGNRRVVDWAPGTRKWKRSVEEQVAKCLTELGLVEAFEVRDVGASGNGRGSTGRFEVRVRQTRGGPWTLLPDVGFGVSQVLPVLGLCYYSPAGSTLILEQPELHLHPSVQAALADVLVNAIRIRNLQVLVESHSEHFLLRLQRRIAEEEVSPRETVLYFCRQSQGRSRAEHLEVDEYGTLANWPEGFFGDSFAEVAKRALRAQERRAEP